MNLKIVNISSTALYSRAFNGLDWVDDFQKVGIESRILSHWQTGAGRENVASAFPSVGFIPKQAVRIAEQLSGYHSRLAFWSNDILKHPWVLESDALHFHVFYDSFMNLRSLVEASRNKPTVVTLHDFWMITGHCVFPGSCLRWSKGCGKCPKLHEPIRAVVDTTRQQLAFKRRQLEEFDGKFHITTQWMRDRVAESWASDLVLPKSVVLPFPEPAWPSSLQDVRQSRESMDIRDFDVVVGARGSKDPRKGLSIALKAIVQSKPKDLKLCLVTVGEKLDRSTIEHLTRAGVVTKQLGWLFDRRRLRDFYQSLDLFVNLSEAETFGLMAQEAASLGCPVMYISGTAVEEVVGGLGISVDGKRVHESALEEFANFLSDPRGVARKISLSKGDSGSRLSRTEFVAAMRSHYFEAAN